MTRKLFLSMAIIIKSFSLFTNNCIIYSMKILLVSDSHGNNEALDLLVKTYPNMDLYLHLGDSESDEYSIFPFRSVRGNCDYFGDFNDQLIISTPYGNLLAQHRPTPNSDLMRDYKVKIFAYGHTHVRKHIDQMGIITINPGAISFARDGNEGSYAILDISNDKVDVEFHDLTEIISKK